MEQDPNGAYAAEWVPELKELPKKYIHQPWLAPHEVLTSAGVTLGQTYPHRITGSAVLQARSCHSSFVAEFQVGSAASWLLTI